MPRRKNKSKTAPTSAPSAKVSQAEKSAAVNTTSEAPAMVPNPVPDTNEEAASWRAKNARAKELIMSTLIPGTEPWQIAEKLESAADIWRALEEKYAPKPHSHQAEEVVLDKGTDKKQHSEGEADYEEARYSDDEVLLEDEAIARATKEFHTSMPSRDQRLLWALLHGGKPETDAWFYGTTQVT